MAKASAVEQPTQNHVADRTLLNAASEPWVEVTVYGGTGGLHRVLKEEKDTDNSRQESAHSCDRSSDKLNHI